MIKLFNLSTHEYDLKKFDHSFDKIEGFMKEYGFDGVELIQNPEWSEEIFPARLVQGLHMRFWPVWLDFWQGDTVELEKQFGSLEAVRHFYGGDSRNALTAYYRRELEIARQLGVRYVVFHVSHVLPEHCFSYEFTYTAEEIIRAAIELLNEVFEGFSGEFELLFENLWWPGLTLLDKRLAGRLLDEVRYPHKGFMLDISHMMNTNLELETEEEGAQYILERLDSLGELAVFIKGIHLNSSLSGRYVKSQFSNRSLQDEKDFIKRYCDSYLHVLKIDNHIPFRNHEIRKVIDRVQPKYLVYEFLTEDRNKLEEYALLQNQVLGLQMPSGNGR